VSGDVFSYTDARAVRGRSDAPHVVELGCMRVLEAYAYYHADAPGAPGGASSPDGGTVLRFVERRGTFARAPGQPSPPPPLQLARARASCADGRWARALAESCRIVQES